MVATLKHYPNINPHPADQRKYRTMPPTMQKRFATLAAWYLKHQVFVEITDLQIDMCDFMQQGFGTMNEDRMLMAYRGIGKTTLIKLFQAWYLSCYPFEQVLFIGNSPSAAKQCGSAILHMIEDLPFFSDLKIYHPGVAGKSKSQVEFNVKGKLKIAGSSWRGITIGTKELTGLRASLMVIDDAETRVEANSTAILTQQLSLIEELYNVQSDAKPHWFKLFVGTFHSQNGLWTQLASGKYNLPMRVYPALYPDLKADSSDYLNRVSPKIIFSLKKNPQLTGKPTDRLGEGALKKKPGGITSSNFRMQYMLDNTGGEESPFPLKCSDLMVTDSLDPSRLPANLVWTNLPEYQLKHLPCHSQRTDAFYGPIYDKDAPQEFAEPDGQIVMYVDSAGRGRDELAWVAAVPCRGRIFVIDIGAYRSDEIETRTNQTIQACKKHDIRLLHVEINNNMAAVELFNSAAKTQGCRVLVKGINSRTKKHKRILNTMSELLAQHRIVFSEEVVRKDIRLSRGELARQLFYQIGYARDAENLGLRFDDRLDALSGICQMLARHIQYSDTITQEANREAQARYQKKLLDHMNGDLAPTHYGNNSFDRLLRYGSGQSTTIRRH